MKKNKLKGKKINLTAVLKALSKSSKFSPEKRANLKATAELLESQQGAVYVEYAFLIAFIAMAAAGGVILLGEQVARIFDELATNVNDVRNAIDNLISVNGDKNILFLTSDTDDVISHIGNMPTS